MSAGQKKYQIFSEENSMKLFSKKTFNGSRGDTFGKRAYRHGSHGLHA